MLPLVIGHRGASGYRPENTLEAFALAFAQGADAVETDLVPTKDGRLILRHENALASTTNVSELPQFSSRHRKGWADGHRTKDWFSEDFSAEEIHELKALERLPDWRPGSSKFDRQFLIPTVSDLLSANFVEHQTLVLELKNGDHFEELGLNLPQLLVAELGRVDWRGRGIRLIFESFDEHCLLEAKRLLPDSGQFMFLSERARIPMNEPAKLAAFLDRVAAEFDGISVDLETLFEPLDSQDPMQFEQFGPPTEFVNLAKLRGLQVYTYTAAVENAVNSIEEYYHRIVSTGVDGIFADQPDLLRNFVAGLA